MNFKVTIAGKAHAIQIPSGWEGISVKQFQQLAKAKGMAQELAALTPINAGDWGEWLDRVSLKDARPLISAMAFLRHVPQFDKLPIPPELLLMGRVVKPLRRAEELPMHAFHNIIEQAKGKQPEEFIGILHVIAGHGLCQSWTRDKYSEETAKRLAEALLIQPVTDIYPISYFFWFAAMQSAPNGQRPSTRRKTKKAKRKRRKPVRVR